MATPDLGPDANCTEGRGVRNPGGASATGIWTTEAHVSPADVERARPVLMRALHRGKRRVRVGEWPFGKVWTFRPLPSGPPDG